MMKICHHLTIVCLQEEERRVRKREKEGLENVMTIYLSNPIQIILVKMKMLPRLGKKKVKSRVGVEERPTLLSMGNANLNS